MENQLISMQISLLHYTKHDISLIRIAWHKNKLLHKYLMFLLITIQIIEVYNSVIFYKIIQIFMVYI